MLRKLDMTVYMVISDLYSKDWWDGICQNINSFTWDGVICSLKMNFFMLFVLPPFYDIMNIYYFYNKKIIKVKFAAILFRYIVKFVTFQQNSGECKFFKKV